MLQKVACLLGVLCCSSFAFAQPDPGPGMAAPDPNGKLLPVEPPFVTTREALNRLNNPTGKIDLSSPESTTRSFVWAFANDNIKAARDCILNPLPYEKLQHLEENLKNDLRAPQFVISDLHAYPQGERAVVTLRLTDISSRQNGFFIATSERLHLRLVEEKWLIVPDGKLENFNEWQEDVLAATVRTLADENSLVIMRNRAAVSACQSNLKQIAFGVMQFLQDWDDKFDLHADWKNQLQPYLKTEVVFHCPEVKEGEESYSLNNELENKFQGNWNEPSQIIMIYEGKEQKFEFRHQGETITNIAFADGHIKAYTKQSLEDAMKAGAVRWKP